MALPAYLKLKGTSQGDIKGSCDKEKHKGTIEVYAIDHEISSPRDIHSGQATGSRQHGAFTITKEVDRSSPQLYQAIATSEAITEVTIEFYRITPEGQEENHYTIKLEKATVHKIKLELPDYSDPNLKLIRERERISFVYGKITWTWHPDGIESSDDWYASRG
jgi:type VI secretion system secreted protein Hcp